MFLNLEFLLFESAGLLVGYRDRTRSKAHKLIRAVRKEFFEINKQMQPLFFVCQVARMTAALLFFLLAGPVMLAAGGPVRFKATNGTIPLVLWHGMGEQYGSLTLLVYVFVFAEF